MLRIIVCLALLVPFLAHSQSYELLENRWEGYVNEKTGAKFEVLSVLRYRISSYASTDDLYVHFYLPSESDAISIIGRTIVQGRYKYRMEASKKKWAVGWQSFGPWPTSDFLLNRSKNQHQNILATNLGVLVATPDRIYPAFISNNDGEIKSSGKYRFYFYTPAPITKITLKLFKDDELVNSIEDTDFDATSSFYLELDEPKLDGEYKLVYAVEWKNTPLPFSKSLTFYHKLTS